MSGSLTVTMTQCSLGSATGNASFKWVIKTPKDGKVVAEGSLKADLPAGTIPRDEQDGAGNNARKAFSQRAADAIADSRLSGFHGQLDSLRHLVDSADVA